MLTRRRFVMGGLQLGALLPVLPRLGRSTSTAEGERVLVVVQLTGGNDGLNTIVPRRQDAYFRSRPTLALKAASLHPLDDEHGFHPALKELGELFAAGRVSVIQGVGYPGMDRSHFRSMEVWHSADPVHLSRGVGWLGRMADQIASAVPGSMPAMHIGDEDLPLALAGKSTLPPSVRDEHGLELRPCAELARERARILAEPAGSGSDLDFLRASARDAYRAAERMSRAAEGRASAAYPELELARKLRLVARLVTGGFDTRLFLVTLGGFDTHARQAALHAARLDELSRSLSAFQRDLDAAGAGQRVVTLVFSEFGRRVSENGSRGTDHGAAAPVLLVGGPWPGGLRGTPPDLERLVDGDVPFTTDFRALYTALERDWMELEPSTPVPAFDLSG